MEGNKELNKLFEAAKSAQEKYTFEETKMQFQSTLAAGAKASLPKSGMTGTQWILAGVVVTCLGGLLGWFLLNDQAEIAIQNAVERVEKKTEVLAMDTTAELDTNALAMNLPDHEFYILPMEGVDFEIKDWMPYRYELPMGVDNGSAFWNLPANPFDDSLLRTQMDAVKFPELTEEEIKAMQEMKSKMLKSISKGDKNDWAFIPVGLHNGKTIQSFYMSKHEVTNEEYRTFLYDLVYQKREKEFKLAVQDNTQWKRLEGFHDALEKMYFSHPAYDQYPVVNISREGAKLYCKWLSDELVNYSKDRKEGLFNPIRIPQRIEWEYAAGLENGNHFTLIHPDSSSRKWENPAPPNFKGHQDGGFHTTSTVHGMMGNYGLRHMLGNAAEMVIDKEGAANAMGGSWLLDAKEFEKEGYEPYKGVVDPNPGVGFRVVMTSMLTNLTIVNPLIPAKIIMPTIVSPVYLPKNEVQITGAFDNVGPFGEYQKNWALIEVGGKLGFIDAYGSQVIAPTYDAIDYFKVYQKKWALVQKEGKYGFIDAYGDEVVPPIYDEIDAFGVYKKDWAMIVLKGKYGFINKYGDVVVEPIYDAIDHFGVIKKNWAMVYKDGKKGFIDESGEYIGN